MDRLQSLRNVELFSTSTSEIYSSRYSFVDCHTTENFKLTMSFGGSNNHVTAYLCRAGASDTKAACFIQLLGLSNLNLQFTTEDVETGDDETKRNLQDSNVCLVAHIHPPFHRDRHRCGRSRRVLLERIPTRNMAARLYGQG